MGACHALDPGSIPGRRVFFFNLYLLENKILIYFSLNFLNLYIYNINFWIYINLIFTLLIYFKFYNFFFFLISY